METITSFDEWVRQRRKALDMTQSQLADRVGCALVTIKKIEQATRRPSRQVAEVLADALAIPDAQRDMFVRMARHQYVEPRTLASHVQSPAADEFPFIPDSMEIATRSSHFVARKHEMAQLATHLTGTFNGSGRFVLIAGEAGCGKTTLMEEFARHALATYPDLIVAGGNCDAYAGVGNPYLPFREMMALLTNDMETLSGAHLLSRDQARRLLALFPHAIQSFVDNSPDLVGVFVGGASLLQRAMAHPMVTDTCRAQLEALTQRQSRSGDVPQRKLFEQCCQVLRSLANRQPLLLLLDDLQWIDHASAELLLYMARQLTGSRVLLLGTYRRSEIDLGTFSGPARGEQTEVHPLTPLIQELKRRYGDIEIDLDQLKPQAGRAFVDALLDSERNLLDESFRAALYQRTGGHPLFTVELLRAMQERSALVQDNQGQWIEGGAVDWQALPARVEAVISLRIGRLPAWLQEALKIASVEGESFTAEVIAHILGVDGWDMVQQLSGVVDRQHHLVAGQGSQRLGNQLLSRYRFVHILFQSYLYGTLDDAERAYLHEAVGHALEQLAAAQIDAVAVQLAHHYQAAGLTAKAVEYLHRAGRQAVALSAHQEAITHLTRALLLLADLPESIERTRLELQLQTDLGVSLKITKGWAAPEVEQVYLRARVLCEQVGDLLPWASVLWGLHSVYSVRGDQGLALEYAQQCLRLAQAQDDPVLRVTSHFMLGCSFRHLGQPALSRPHFEEALAANPSRQHRTYIFLAGVDLGVFGLAQLAHTLWYLGYPDNALRQGQEAVKLAQALAHPFSHVVALSYLTMLHQFRRDWCAVQAAAETVHRLCVEQDFPYYLAWATFMQGAAMNEHERAEQGIAQMEQSLADLQAMQAGLRGPLYRCLMAEAYGKVGRVEDGLRLLADAFAQAYKQRQLTSEPELYRVQGELLRKQDATDERVESCFRHALKVAQRQESKSLELRAAASLARLRQSQGEYVDARRTLAEVVTWFSEGFETADLQEARTLLDTFT